MRGDVVAAPGSLTVTDRFDARFTFLGTPGDERAFATLYDRFAARMYRVALRILGSREDAEDVVQEVFLATVRVHERLADVRDLTA